MDLGRALRRAAGELRGFADLDAGAARAVVERRLRRVARDLAAAPGHLRRLAAAGLSPRELRGLDDLAAFPVLTRGELAAGFAELCVLRPGARCHTARSSGSTGEPVRVLRDELDAVYPWAVIRLLAAEAGARLPARPRVALLCTLPGGREASAALPLFGGGRLERISARRPGAAARLAAFAPDLLSSDPAGLAWLLACGPALRPRLVYSSAMQLGRELRARVEAATAAPVVNVYSTVESGPVARECAHGRFHPLLPDVWVESVGGELLLTRLRPGPFPLLRYATGDRGRLEAACPCGRSGPAIAGFVGRVPAVFHGARGPVDGWALAPILRRFPLGRFRLVEEAEGVFRLEIAARRAPPGLARAAAAALAELGIPYARVRVEPGMAPDDARKPAPFVSRM